MFSDFVLTRISMIIAVVALALLATSCAAFRPTDVTGPESNLTPYPIMLENDDERQNNTIVAWRQMAQHFAAVARPLDVVVLGARVLDHFGGAEARLRCDVHQSGFRIDRRAAIDVDAA